MLVWDSNFLKIITKKNYFAHLYVFEFSFSMKIKIDYSEWILLQQQYLLEKKKEK